MATKKHWEHIYSTRAADSIRWFQDYADLSLRLIEQTGIAASGAIVDVGGAAAHVDDLLKRSYTSLSVLDLSEAALNESRKRLGSRAVSVLLRY